MTYKELVMELVTELYKMDIDELLDFKEDEARELEAKGIPKKTRDRCIRIVDVVIRAKKERMGEEV